ncbi:PEGA domain-containing protein [Myxococcota bacterium]|nr:PEGA domain-containing protein [Myxococcota bacterium]
MNTDRLCGRWSRWLHGVAVWSVLWSAGLVQEAHAERLVLRSTPSATVWVNGERRGKTPLDLRLPVGRHHLELRHPNRLTWTSHVILPSRSELTLRVRLEERSGDGAVGQKEEGKEDGKEDGSPRLEEPLPRQGSPFPKPESSGLLIAQSTPSGAQVFQGERMLGRTPLLASLPIGTHVLRFVLDGHKSIEKSINIQPSISSRLSIRFEGGGRETKDAGDGAVQQDGQGSQTQFVVLSNPTGAKVTLNGRYMGQTPVISGGLAVGNYLLRVESEGFSPYTRRIRISEGQEIRLKVLLIPRVRRKK